MSADLCRCRECADLDRAHPRQGRQLALLTRPIDETARDGRHYLVTDGETFAVAAWWSGQDGSEAPAGCGHWRFPGGAPLGFEPQAYQP